MRNFAIAALCALIPISGFAADEGNPQSKYGAEFGKHWSNAKELTLAIAEAMPANEYAFKPDPEEMSFGEQIAHIAAGNYSYCAALGKTKSPFAKPANYDKATVSKLVGESFDYCSGTIASLTDEQLGELRGPEGRQSSVREVMLGLYTHMAHHRGQTEVYLRIKGIKPPSYKF
jgi:uncharacterized damage-inducible protein DinB